MIKVSLDTTPLTSAHKVRGIGAYTRNLVEALKKRKDVKLVRKKPDLVHIPYFDLFFDTLRVGRSVPTVVTVYDVIPLIYPEHYPPGIKGRLRSIKQKRKIKDVDAVITISETSKKDIVRFLDVPQERVFVTHLAPGSSFKKLATGNWQLETAKRYGLPKRFVLYVGDVNYNKNILNLVKACKLIHLPLVIVGKQAVDDFDRNHIENQPLLHLIEEYGDDKDVLRVGYVLNEDLAAIYNLATVYCQSSFYEGFGLPVLEAMAAGTPVVAAKTQALVEIAEDTAYFVNPKKPEDIAHGLEKVILRNILRKKGLEHVKKFSWDKTAEATVEVYKKVLQ